MTTTNALMKEDLAISKNSILSLQNENRTLKLRLEQYESSNGPEDQPQNGEKRNSPSSSDTEADAAAKALKDEQACIEAIGASDCTILSSAPGKLTITELSRKLLDERSLTSDLQEKVQKHVS